MPPQDAGVCTFISRLGFDDFIAESLGVRYDLPVSAKGQAENVVITLSAGLMCVSTAQR